MWNKLDASNLNVIVNMVIMTKQFGISRLLTRNMSRPHACQT